MSGKRRVVVTGTGILSPLGGGKKAIWEALCEGRSGIELMQCFDTEPFDVKIAGEVKGFDAEEYFDRRTARRLDRFTQFAIITSEEALADSGIEMNKEDPRRVGCIIGTGIGGLHTIEEQHLNMLQRGVNRVSPIMIPKLMCNAAAGIVSMRLGCFGPSMSISSACASGSNAIGEAFRSVRAGISDVMICGGSEAALTPMGVGGFQNMKALSKQNDRPHEACRPFDANRDGFVVAEGAGILVLEELERARKRGAEIFAEVLGYGCATDAYHITLPEPQGRGAKDAMLATFYDSGCVLDDVDYINAHGTGTPAGDDIEAKAIYSVFGEKAKDIPVSSTKSMIGHLLGASGPVESIFCIWAMKHGVIPPTINFETPDPECCGLDFVPNTAREIPVRLALNNSFGFGGHNVGLLLGRFEG